MYTQFNFGQIYYIYMY